MRAEARFRVLAAFLSFGLQAGLTLRQPSRTVCRQTNRLGLMNGCGAVPAPRAACGPPTGRSTIQRRLPMGSLKKRRKAKINKHKRRKKLRAHRHKKRTWQK